MVSLGRCCIAFVPARSAAANSALQLMRIKSAAAAVDSMPPEANNEDHILPAAELSAPSVPGASILRAEDIDGKEELSSLRSSTMHFCFIAHGHQGRPGDLSYLHRAVKATAANAGRFDVRSSETCVVGKMDRKIESAGDDAQDGRRSWRRRRSKRDRLPPSTEAKEETEIDAKDTLVVHNAACNEGRTGDGIANGGERLADEMLAVIRGEVRRKMQRSGAERERTPVDVSISIVGNSLGGLYGRYAVAHLAEIILDGDESDTHYLLDGHIRIHFNVFCSTASPHLGCASHTYVPIPRAAEIGVAKAMGATGHDLFRLNDVVEEMATTPRFLAPLAAFRRRIAYANAYNTDFPVPGSTAAFLDGESEYPHHFDERLAERENAQKIVEHGETVGTESKDAPRNERGCPAFFEKGLIVATLHAPRSSPEENTGTKDGANEMTRMSASLDSLGWKKVFVNMSSEVPNVSLPSLSGSSCPLGRLQSAGKSVSSRDLEKAVSTTSARGLSLPLGHNAICAFSRSSVSTAINSGGRPVMDSLAIELIREISSHPVAR
ncbi:hypothetical protein ACHAXT_009876 [Thalassiosira profunda]